ncbi:MAG TPA: MlaD family protein [Methylomirabilota bacterium]|nr:MlaD family protein [Methylomirabilota bacterium]
MTEKRENGVKFRVGLFVLVALLTFLGAVYALGARARLFEARYTIHADFTEVGGLVEGATVRLAGVQIGRVSAVSLPPQPGGKVRVDLTIARRFSDRIRKNSVARIETQGLLGDRIVEITVGDATAPPVLPGEVLASRDPADFGRIVAAGAETAKNVAALADALRETADQINKSKMIESAASTVSKLGRVVDQVEQGRGWAHTLLYEEPIALKRLNELIASTQTVIERVEKGQGAAGVLVSPESTASAKRFVAAVDRLSAMVEQPEREPGLLPGLLFDPKYKAVLDDLKVVSHNLRLISDRVAGGKGTLGSLVADTGSEDGSLSLTMQDLRTAMANLKSISEKINEGEGTVGLLIADPTIYERLVTILDGAQRSFLLRSMIKSLGDKGAKSRDDDTRR